MQSSFWLSLMQGVYDRVLSSHRQRRRWRRGALLSGAIAVVLLTSGSQIQADTFTPAPGTAQTAYIDPPPGYNVNIRSGPGTQFAAVNTLRSGTAIALTGRYENGWAELTNGSWVVGNLISGRPGGSGGDGRTAYTAVVATPAGYNLNLRRGPGIQFVAVNTLARGTQITVTNRYENGWVQLVDGSWAAGNFVQVGNPVAIAPTPSTPASPATAAANNNGVLQRGSQGEAVTNLQTRLQALGYLPVTAQPNGQFDDATVQAVMDFQRVHNLPSDGVAGPQTLNVIYSADALYKNSAAPNNPVASPSPTVSPTPTASPSPSPTASPTPTASPSPTPTPTASPSPIPTVSPNPDPTATPPASGQARDVLIQTDNGMETPIFSGPGTEHELVEFLPDGTLVRITGRIENNWAELESGGWAFVPWLAL